MQANNTFSKVVRDAVHGDIELDDDEMRVIATKEFQRLRRVKQLGLAYLVYPSATHTRFEHSLGVCYMAQTLIDRLNRHNLVINEYARKVIRYAALLHDVGHLPFGHTLEDERPVIPDAHDDYDRLQPIIFNSEIGLALAEIEQKLVEEYELTKNNPSGSRFARYFDDRDETPHLREDVLRVLCASKEKLHPKVKGVLPKHRLFAAIISNTICADLLDYLKRDCYYSGIHHTYDDRVLMNFVAKDGVLYIDLDGENGVRQGLVSEIVHMLRLRYTLGERVYYHRTKTIASAMISKAVEIVGFSHSQLLRLGDEDLMFLLNNPDLLKRYFPEINASEMALQAASRLSTGIRSRRLYVPVYRLSRSTAGNHTKFLHKNYHEPANIATRQELEEKLAKKSGLQQGDVIVYCPDKDMSLKAAMVQVRTAPTLPPSALKESEGLSTATEEINLLHRKHEALWTLDVVVVPEATEEQRKAVAATCLEVIKLPNDIPEYRSVTPQSTAKESLMRSYGDRQISPNRIDEILVAMNFEGMPLIAAHWPVARPELFEQPALDLKIEDAFTTIKK